MLLAGDTVQSRVSGERGTVVAPPLTAGMVRVRFDGERNPVEVHESRVHKINVSVAEAKPIAHPDYFLEGDYVQIVNGNGDTERGAALTQYPQPWGGAIFDMLTDDGRYLEVNANYYNITVLFRADVARGDKPKY